MGWDTYLTLNDGVIQSWRKQAVYMPAMLFAESDRIIVDSPAEKVVKWRTTASGALKNLSDRGFTWSLLLEDYVKTYAQHEPSSAGYLRGLLWEKAQSGGEGRTEVGSPADTAIQELTDSSPEEELKALGQLLLAETVEESGEAVEPQDNGKWPSRVSRAGEFLFESDSLLINPMDIGDFAFRHGVLELARPIEYLLASRQEAPLVAWVFSQIVLLHEAPSTAVVELDLSEDAQEVLEAYGGTADEYARSYWRSAAESTAQSASFYGRVFTKLALGTTDIATPLRFGRVEALFDAACETGLSRNEQGARLEDLVAALVELSGSWVVLEKRVKHEEEELDLVLRNDSKDAFWLSLGSPMILVECKNWSRPVGIDEFRVFESKVLERHRMCKVGVFVALNGFTRPFLDRVRSVQDRILVLPVDREDIAQMLDTRVTLDDWLRDKGLRRVL